jgi:hypothetical protein
MVPVLLAESVLQVPQTMLFGHQQRKKLLMDLILGMMPLRLQLQKLLKVKKC